MNSVYCTLLQPWNRFSKAQECESPLSWLSCLHSRTGHGIMHSSPREEESFTSQIPQVGVFSNKAITLMTSWWNFCNQSGPFKYSKTQSLLCFWLTCCYKPHHQLHVESEELSCHLTAILTVLPICLKYLCLFFLCELRVTITVSLDAVINGLGNCGRPVCIPWNLWFVTSVTLKGLRYRPQTGIRQGDYPGILGGPKLIAWALKSRELSPGRRREMKQRGHQTAGAALATRGFRARTRKTPLGAGGSLPAGSQQGNRVPGPTRASYYRYIRWTIWMSFLAVLLQILQ